MRNLLTTIFYSSLICCFFLFCACKKDVVTETHLNNIVVYDSTADFHIKNQARTQNFTIDASLGGEFIGEKGTKVIVSPYSFATTKGDTIKGKINFEFIEIYLKSEMLLSDKPTSMFVDINAKGKPNTSPLKSAGEFFIRPTSDSGFVVLKKEIRVEQPALVIDNKMKPFVEKVLPKDTAQGLNWIRTNSDSIYIYPQKYVYRLFSFASQNNQGTWCNSDNADYFPVINQVAITLKQTDDFKLYKTDVFLVFKNVTSMVHVYNDGIDFPYNYAPNNEPCTLVAVGIKDGKIYASFLPIVITSGAVFNFSMTETSEEEFKSKLKALD